MTHSASSMSDDHQDILGTQKRAREDDSVKDRPKPSGISDMADVRSTKGIRREEEEEEEVVVE